MAVTLNDLITPAGELVPEMLPDMDLEVTVASWLKQAVAAVSLTGADPSVVDKAIKHWVYGRAYRTIARRLALQPNSASAEEVSESVGADRIKYFDRLADYHDGQFEALTLLPVPNTSYTGTRSVRTQVYW